MRAVARITAALLLCACTDAPAGSGGDRGGHQDEGANQGQHRSVASSQDDSKPAAGGPGPHLPRGGRTLFPHHRVVAYYGTPRTQVLGVLGDGEPREIARRLLDEARRYGRSDRPVLPAFELIATMALESPGPDGDFNVALSNRTVRRYLKTVRHFNGLLILDIQPGRSPFLEEVKRYANFLAKPDVGLALDPEWSWGPSEGPDQGRGHTTGAVVNAVSTWLAGIVRRHDLPQKLLLVHQFAPDMILNRDQIRARPGLAVTFHIDGFGTRAAKLSKYRALRTNRKGLFNGFKLFYESDVDMLAPRDVLGLEPAPDLVTYQ